MMVESKIRPLRSGVQICLQQVSARVEEEGLPNLYQSSKVFSKGADVIARGPGENRASIGRDGHGGSEEFKAKLAWGKVFGQEVSAGVEENSLPGEQVGERRGN